MIFWEYFSFISLVFISAFSGLCAFLIFFNNPKKKTNILSSLMNAGVAAWSGCWAVQLFSSDYASALFWGRMINLFAVLLTIFFNHWILALLKADKEKKNRIILFFGYILSIFFIFADIFTLDFISSVKSSSFFNYYSYPGSLYIFFLAFLYFGLTGYSFYSALRTYFKTKDTVLKNQLKYVLLGAPFGILGGATSYFLFYDIPIPPFGLPLVVIYFGCLNYAMIRHRLMDVRTVVGTTGVYLFSLLMVIVWANALSYLNIIFFLLPLPIFATITAITSIILFMYSLRLLNNIAAKYFYYSLYALKDAIAGLTKKLNRTIDLESILISIDYTLLGSLRLEKIGIVLKDPETSVFALRHFIGLDEKKINGFAEKNKVFLISLFKKTKDVLVKDEIPILSEMILKKYPAHLNTIKEGMESAEIDVLVPLFIEDDPIGLILLGKKLSMSGYSTEEVRLLEEFSVQTAIALNNATALNQAKKRETELEKFYKLTLGRELRMIELKNKIKELENNKKY